MRVRGYTHGEYKVWLDLVRIGYNCGFIEALDLNGEIETIVITLRGKISPPTKHPHINISLYIKLHRGHSPASARPLVTAQPKVS